MTLCAACGIGEDDGIKMKKCTACDLARYCSDKCQLEHLPEHEQTCKKRAAELRDDILFKQPESSHFGDCPICCLPLSIYTSKSTPMECCSKVICGGCAYADTIRELVGSREVVTIIFQEAGQKVGSVTYGQGWISDLHWLIFFRKMPSPSADFLLHPQQPCVHEELQQSHLY